MVGEHARARCCIEETRDVATHGFMQPYLADCYLAFARQDLAESRKDSANDNVTKAKYMIERMGYHRRDRELDEILRAVNF